MEPGRAVALDDEAAAPDGRGGCAGRAGRRLRRLREVALAAVFLEGHRVGRRAAADRQAVLRFRLAALGLGLVLVRVGGLGLGRGRPRPALPRAFLASAHRHGLVAARIAGRLGRVDRRLEGGHQVDELAALLGRLDRDGLLALDLGLDDRLERLAVLVLVLRPGRTRRSSPTTSCWAIASSAGLKS